jgi:hypothetical protein
MRNPKSQVPNPKEVPSSKLQELGTSGCLRFGAWDFFGTWDLGFGALA